MMKRSTFLKSLVVGITLSQQAISQQAPALTKSGVKITAIKPYVLQKALYVKIETDAGISGWGEGDHESTKVLDVFIDEVLSKILLEKDPFDSEYLWHEMFFEGYENGSTGINPGAIAGIDNALWDLKGKILNMSVSKLLGGSSLEKVAVYGSYGRRKKGGFKLPREWLRKG